MIDELPVVKAHVLGHLGQPNANQDEAPVTVPERAIPKSWLLGFGHL